MQIRAKLAIAILLLIGLVPAAKAQTGASIYGQAMTPYGTPAANARIWVCPYTATGTPCTPTSTIYSDPNLTRQITQPYSADQYGNFDVFVPAGMYLVQVQINQTVYYSYTISASNQGSGVTSVAQTVPAWLSVGGSPVTGAGTLAITANNESANTVLAGPTSGGAAAPGFRALVPADVPPINLAASGNGGVTGLLPNTNLANSSTTVNGQSCALGGTCAVADATKLPLAGGTLTGSADAMIFNPFRSGVYPTNSVIGPSRNYFLTGTIPGTSTYNYGQLSHFASVNYMQDAVPGCWGFTGSCYNTEHQLNGQTLYINGGGGTNVNTITANFFSVGDHIGSENYITSFGGSVDGGGPEGTKGASEFVSEASDTWTGTVATGSVGQTTIKANCSTDCGSGSYGIGGTPGVSYGSPASVGQGLIVTDEQSPIASCQIMSVANASGETPGTFTCNVTSGLTNLAVSTCEATLTSNLSPTVNPSGSGSQSMTFTVNDVMGACTAGGLISFTGTNHEQALITSVTAPSGGQQTITANVRLYHESGSYIFENANSDAGLFGDILVNHTGSLSFPVEVVGVQSVSGNTAVMWWRDWYAGQPPAGGSNSTGFPYGRMTLMPGTNYSLSNTGGTVTLSGGANINSNNPQFWNATLMISGASNSAFNGLCTNSHTDSTTGNFVCTQSASTGLSATGATITIADPNDSTNIYGNSTVKLYQGAAIIDPQDYSAPIVVNGVSNPVVDGKQFTIEPNFMAQNAGDKLVQHHSAPQFHSYEGTTTVQNPNCYSCNGMDVEITGISGNGGSWQNNAAYRGLNNASQSQYSYFGGTLTPPDWGVVGGQFNNTLDLSQPPAMGASIINVRACPASPSSCTDTNYYYDLFNFPGNGGSNAAQYYPATNILKWTQPLSVNLPNGASPFAQVYYGYGWQGIAIGGMVGHRAGTWFTPLEEDTGTQTNNDLIVYNNCDPTYKCGILDSGISKTNLPTLNGTNTYTGSNNFTGGATVNSKQICLQDGTNCPTKVMSFVEGDDSATSPVITTANTVYGFWSNLYGVPITVTNVTCYSNDGTGTVTIGYGTGSSSNVGTIVTSTACANTGTSNTVSVSVPSGDVLNFVPTGGSSTRISVGIAMHQ